MSRTRRPAGMTAIEVLASTLLAAMLMTALLGVLRGLKAQERLLDAQAPTEPWQQSLDAALASDLSRARTYETGPQSLLLRGYGGRGADGAPNWLPATIVYEVRSIKDQSWLVRRELPTVGGDAPQAADLVLAGVKQIRVGMAPIDADPVNIESGPKASALAAAGKESPLLSGLVVEFWGDDIRGPIYGYQFRQP